MKDTDFPRVMVCVDLVTGERLSRHARRILNRLPAARHGQLERDWREGEAAFEGHHHAPVISPQIKARAAAEWAAMNERGELT